MQYDSEGDHAIFFCDSLCNYWLHRRCAGPLKHAFTTVVNPTNPYLCPNYTALKQVSFITALKVTILD